MVAYVNILMCTQKSYFLLLKKVTDDFPSIFFRIEFKLNLTWNMKSYQIPKHTFELGDVKR